MSDAYSSVRGLPFPQLAGLLGIDLQRFKRRKEDWQGYCPVHNGKNNNSFAYHDTGKFHCFSCDAKGSGAIDLTMQLRKLGFKAACELLGSVPVETAMATPKASPEPESGVLRPLEKDTWRKFQVACEWLEKRVPDAAIRDRYGVFCYENKARKSAYSGRVMIPVKDLEGVMYGYLGRLVPQSAETTDSAHNQPAPKYLFPKSVPKSRFLFGAYELAQHLQSQHQAEPRNGDLRAKVLYLLESPFAVMKFASMGLPALALYGWSVSHEQCSILPRLARGLVYLPDRNKRTDAQACLGPLAETLWVRFPPLPNGIDDPEQLSREQVLAL